MMTSSNGDIFRVTGHLCGEVTGEFPIQRPVRRSFDGFFYLPLNKRLSEQLWGWWLRRHRVHYDVVVMIEIYIINSSLCSLLLITWRCYIRWDIYREISLSIEAARLALLNHRIAVKNWQSQQYRRSTKFQSDSTILKHKPRGCVIW